MLSFISVNRKFYLILALLVVAIANVLAQQTSISGTVYDLSTGETLPFTTVKFKGTTISATTDFDGKYKIETDTPSDFLVAISFGFEDVEKPVKKGEVQVIDFKMGESVTELEVVKIERQENPAHNIIRKVIELKDQNDIKKLEAYECEVYSKVELDIDNISEKFKKKKFMKSIGESFDNMGMVTDENGKEVLPIFISETMSDYFYKKDPSNQFEKVKATRVTGIGVEDGSFVSQLVGTSFQQFNFYQNNVVILEKDFVSPFSSGWKGFYKYIIEDTLVYKGDSCFYLEVYPKRAQDLGFKGFMWIDTKSYALKKVDFTIPKEANLNFIDEIKLVQEWARSQEDAWFVAKSQLTIDVGDLSDNWASMILKSTITNDSFVFSSPKENKFYEYQLEVSEDANEKPKEFWEENRHYELSEDEKKSFVMVDSLKNMPSVKTYLDVIYTVVNGYKTIGWWDLGPYLYLYSWNEVEGHKVRIGGRTNEDFSKKWVVNGYVAPSEKDRKVKYSIGVKYILDRTPWTEIGINRRYDLDQLGVPNDLGDNVYQALVRWGKIVGPYYSTENNVFFKRQLSKSFSTNINVTQSLFDPLFSFNYFPEIGDTSITKSKINNSFATVKLRFAKDELFIQQGNSRKSLGAKKLPELSLKYTVGVKGVLGSDFSFHKVDFMMEQRVGLGKFGVFHYWGLAGHVFSNVPFPLLNVHLGNESPIYVNYAFSLLDYFEFVSDSYASINIDQHFNGYFFNRVPLFNRLKWREVVNFHVLYGKARQENFDIIAPESTRFTAFDSGLPYVEVGYGIENIFKFVRIEAFHRLTYRDRGKNNFGIKGTLQLTL